MRRLVLTAMALVCLTASVSAAGKYNPTVEIGDKAPGFGKLPATDGKQYAVKDFAKAEVLVVVFTCNSCPYAIDYEDRLNAFQKEFCADGKVALIAINSNLVTADSLEKMRERAKEKAFRFPYLFDASQKTAKEFGALRTPECFVLNKDRKIVYMGAFDDSADADEVKQKYVPDAVQAVLNGTDVEVAETAPVGCLIRFKRRRERK